jgi:butyrate kinase
MSNIQAIIAKSLASSAKKGAYVINKVSKDEQFFQIVNVSDNSTFDMKVSNFAAKVKDGSYTLHDDDSYDMKDKPVRKAIEY